MFIGVDFQRAINYWNQGREVIVLDRTSRTPAGGYETYFFDELFRNLDFLVDVPAVGDPEVQQAVTDRVNGYDQTGSSAVTEGDGNEIPPHPPTRPGVDERPPAGKTKKELALELAEAGLNASQIAKQLGAKYGTVYSWLNPKKCRPNPKNSEIPEDYINPDARPGWNVDRKKCQSCVYRQSTWDKKIGRGSCNYLEITGHSRVCAVENCDRYVKGPRIEKPKKRVH